MEDIPTLPDIDELLSTARAELLETFVSFIETHFSEDINAILLQSDETLHYGLSIPYPFISCVEAEPLLTRLLGFWTYWKTM